MGQRVIIELPTGEQFGVDVARARDMYPDATVLTNDDGSPYRPDPRLTAGHALAGELDNPITALADADERGEAERLAKAAQEAPVAPAGAEAGMDTTPPGNEA